jgi:hypothetical protein
VTSEREKAAVTPDRIDDIAAEVGTGLGEHGCSARDLGDVPACPRRVR